MIQSYFRPSRAPAAVAAHVVFPFALDDARGAGVAFQAASAVAAELGAEVVAWRRPVVSGPWSSVAEVGDDAGRLEPDVDDEAA